MPTQRRGEAEAVLVELDQVLLLKAYRLMTVLDVGELREDAVLATLRHQPIQHSDQRLQARLGVWLRPDNATCAFYEGLVQVPVLGPHLLGNLDKDLLEAGPVLEVFPRSVHSIRAEL